MRWLKWVGVGVLSLGVAAANNGLTADSNVIDFETTYIAGTVNGQDGWSATGAYDHEVTGSYGYGSFGTQSFRMSNAITSGSFGDWVFSKSLGEEAGETAADNGGLSGGTRRNYFEASWDFASTVPGAEQPGLQISASPDRGDGGRMSFVRLKDLPAGLAVEFADYQAGVNEVGCTLGNNFIFTTIAAGLNRTVPHNIKIAIQFVDGTNNDIVKVYIDGNLVHIGTSWEGYFNECEGNLTRTVDSVLFQARTNGGTAPTTIGNGFLIDNLSLYSAPFAPPSASTVLITPANLSTDGMNNNKWFFYNDGGVGNPDGPETGLPTNSLGSFVTGPSVAPVGVGSAQVSVDSLKRRNLATSQYGGTILGNITQLKFSTYNPSAGNGGSANRSAYLHFNVDFNGSNNYQWRLVFVPTTNGPVTQDTWQEWDAIKGGNALYVYSKGLPSNWPPTATGPHAGINQSSDIPRTWNDLLADYPGIRMLARYPFLGLRVGEPYENGYTENMDKFVFGTAPTVTTYDFDPNQIKVHILKKLDEATATAASAGGYKFPMVATWSTSNIGSGTGEYVLGNSHGDAANQYGADTSPMTSGAAFTTSEITGGSSLVLPIGAACESGKFQLQGYSTSAIGFDDAATKARTSTAPQFVNLDADQYVLVWNNTCPTTGTLTINKKSIGGDGSFSFTDNNGLGSFNITTVGSVGSKTFDSRAPGTYSITETVPYGWTKTTSTCSLVTVTAGSVASCTIVNTKNLCPAFSNEVPGKIRGLIAYVDDLNLKKSKEKKLDHELDKALKEVGQCDQKNACKHIGHFIKEVQKKKLDKCLTIAEELELLRQARAIAGLLGCS